MNTKQNRRRHDRKKSGRKLVNRLEKFGISGWEIVMEKEGSAVCQGCMGFHIDGS